MFEKKSTINNKHRFMKAFKHAYYGANNDGFAVRIATQAILQNKNNKSNLIIVWSDGLPSSSEFNSLSAAENLKRAIAEARKLGIAVMAFAVVPRLKERLDQLYGSKYVVDVSNKAVMAKEIKKIVLAIQENNI
jgi:nitric oxide reductase activation protein